MVLIADVSIPASQFALGQLFDSFPDIELELERLVPMETGIIPLFWMAGADEETVRQALETDPLVRSVRCLTQTGDRALFEIVWSPEVNGVIQPLVRSEGDVLRATGTAVEWEFRLLFADRTNLAQFRDDCLRAGVQLELRRLFSPDPPTNDTVLTEEQHDVIMLAFEEGYWLVPRNVTLQELADRIGISDSAVSQRLRRGVHSLVNESVIEP